MKILFALHEDTMSPANLDFACYIARVTHSRLTGVVMETLDHEAIYASEDPDSKAFHHVVESTDLPANAPVRQKADLLAERFREGCGSRELTISVHRDRGIPSRELVHETRFADLLLLDARTGYPNAGPGAPSAFVKHMLVESECPVLVLPEGRHEVRELIYTYDGHASSMHAIRQFSYLFPQWRDLPVVVIEAGEEKKDISHKHSLHEWLTEHYSHVRFELQTLSASDVLMENVLGRTDSIVVMGAFGRKGLSALLKRSEGDPLLKLISQPLFIAHH